MTVFLLRIVATVTFLNKQADNSFFAKWQMDWINMYLALIILN